MSLTALLVPFGRDLLHPSEGLGTLPFVKRVVDCRVEDPLLLQVVTREDGEETLFLQIARRVLSGEVEFDGVVVGEAEEDPDQAPARTSPPVR